MTMTDENPKPNELKVPPPPRRQTRGLIAEIPKQAAAPDNLSKPNTGMQDMNFKMDSDFHRAFKMSATKRNMAMKEMLEAAYRCWVEHNGDDDDKRWLPSK